MTIPLPGKSSNVPPSRASAQREHNPTANDSADDRIKNIGIRDGMYGRKI
jgi:hypothetical protein